MKRIVTVALALAMLGGAAHAEPDRDGRDRYRDRDRDRDRPSGHYQPGAGYNATGRPGDRRWGAVEPLPQRRWERGQRLPNAYWGGAVDYRSNRLRRPPRGYQWVQAGGDFLLMDQASGMVLDVIPGR